MQKVTKMMVVMVLVSGTLASADLMTINPVITSREGAWEGAIYSYCQQVIDNNSFCAWVDGEEGEYRAVSEFNLMEAKGTFTPEQVNSAVLKFTANPWANGRRALTVEQIFSDLWNYGNEMYVAPWSTVHTDGWISGDYSLNITEAFKSALGGASSSQGMSYRWSNDNDASDGLPAPYTGLGPDWVVVNSGFTLSGIAIEVIYVPEPATLSLLALGLLGFVRGRK